MWSGRHCSGIHFFRYGDRKRAGKHQYAVYHQQFKPGTVVSQQPGLIKLKDCANNRRAGRNGLAASQMRGPNTRRNGPMQLSMDSFAHIRNNTPEGWNSTKWVAFLPTFMTSPEQSCLPLSLTMVSTIL